jgi:hypothetical protein
VENLKKSTYYVLKTGLWRKWSRHALIIQAEEGRTFVARLLLKFFEKKTHFICTQGDQMGSWKIAQNVAQPVFCQNLYINFTAGKSLPKNLGCFFNFQEAAQSKLLLNGQKFAQSGHPVCTM